MGSKSEAAPASAQPPAPAPEPSFEVQCQNQLRSTPLSGMEYRLVGLRPAIIIKGIMDFDRTSKRLPCLVLDGLTFSKDA